MKIIGICGRKRHGKDTVGNFLQLEGRYTPLAFADPIKRIAMDLYGFTYEQVYGLEKEIPDPRWDGLTPRHALQQIGTEMARGIHKETWIRYGLNIIEQASRGKQPRIHWAPSRGFTKARHDLIIPGRENATEWGSKYVDLDRWCITDVRFPNEAEMIRAAGGKVIKVVRPSLEGKQGDTHASETSLDSIEPDLLLVNDGSLDDLHVKVRQSVFDL